MKGNLLLFMLACTAGTGAFAQSTDVSMQQAKVGRQDNNAGKTAKSGIRLNPSNRYNVAPKDAFQWQAANGKTQNELRKTPAAAKIAAAAEYPDSLNCYGILDPSYGIDVEGRDLHHAYSFQAAPGLALHAVGADAELPDATTYVRKGNDWYCFTNDSIFVVDAKTYEKKQTVAYKVTPSADMDEEDLNEEGYVDINLRRAGGTYDPSDNCFYIGTWSGLMKISADNIAKGEIVADFPGYLFSLAAGPDGLYMVINPGKLYKYDKTTGESTLVLEKAYARSWANQGQSSAFDWATNTLYVSYMDGKWLTHLDKIDLATNTPAQGFDFSDAGATMMGLYIPYASADAPAAPTGIVFADGKLSFKAPTQTYRSGQALTGELTAYVTVDGTEQTHTVQAGEQTSLDLTLADGFHEIFIEVGNQTGRSPERVTRPYVGQDVPSAVTGLSLNTDDGQHLSLSWTAPTSTKNGGPVDDDNVNYTVKRYPDNIVVAENLKETAFSEDIPESHQRYYYEVTAFNGNRAGGVAVSNKVPAGKVWFPPYTEEFRTQEDFDFFTVIDGNNDGQTWKHMQPSNNEEQGIAYLNGNGVTNAETGAVATYDNDYLVTPSISLKKGNDYRLSFNVGDHWLYTETMEVLLGTSTDTTSVVKTIAPTFTMRGNGETYTYIYNVPEDGLYNIFFHVNSVGNSVNVIVDNVSVELYANFEGPDSVTSLTATAAAKGELLNTLSFTTPTKSYKGGALSSISRVDVYRNGEATPAKVFEKPGMGQQLSWTDTEAGQGSVTYRVVPFNENGQGVEALVTNWVGLDVPANPSNVKAVMNDDNLAVLTWDKVGEVGIHGGYVNPDDVQYTLYRYNEYDYMDHWQAVTDATSGLTLTDEDYYPSWGAQQEYVDYIVRASNKAGTDEGTGVGIVLGEPYALPYAESFPSATPAYTPWTLFADSYNYAWNNVSGSGLSVKPYDGDEGMLQFQYLSEESNKQVITGPRVSLAETVNPELSFYMYHGFETEEDELQLDIYVNYQDQGWELVKSVPYNNGADGWTRYSLPLDATSKDVQFGFAATAVDASAAIYVDAIQIGESTANDIVLQSFSATKRLEQGETGTATVAVANYGRNSADAFEVVLLKNGEKIASQQGTNLAQNDVKTFTFPLPTSKVDASTTLKLQAVAVWNADENTANDSSAVASLYVHGSTLPTAENLTGDVQVSSVTLNWQAPATNEVADATTDDFDSYEAFIIDNIGDWQTYDADGFSTGYFSGPEIPHVYEAKAWQVYNPETAGFSLEKFPVLTPHSGAQYLTSWVASEYGYEASPQDDWLISPEVKGGTDIDFYYRVPNAGSDAQTFEILYSENSDDAADFIRLDRDSVEGTTDWVHFVYTIPSSAKYFAIRNVTKGNYTVACLDDLTYTPLYGSTTELTLKGYNVYRDNELIGTVEAGVTSFSETVTDTDAHDYHVTAVWDAGESNYSNGYTADIAAAISKPAAAGSLSVKGGRQSILVAGAEDTVYVYGAAGQTVACTSVNGSAVIAVPAGVYAVKANGATVKVIVK